MILEFTVNGSLHRLDIEPNLTLLEVIRHRLWLTGTKECCDLGECGSCTVLVDGLVVNCCLMLAAEAMDCEVTTVEGLAADGRLSPIQDAFLAKGAAQCGFCTPGQLVAAQSLLQRVPHPTSAEVREALAGNLCRCGCYNQICEAVLAAAEDT